MSLKQDTGKLAISVKNVGVAYQRRAGFFRKEKFWALKDVSFDVFHGETLGVIGGNGAGKSTLLRLLAGIISPDKGRVTNYSVSASLLSLQVGFIQHLTGRENSILSGMMLGLSKNEVLAQIDNIRAYADIGDFFDQPVHVYSAGMRARLGFSVAVYIDSDVILMDEILGVGDQDFREKSKKTMQETINTDKTIVLVSHNTKLIEDVCDRVIWVKNGTIQNKNDVSETLQNYINKK